ncbi:hypothetical protein C8J57DRAFT_1258305 [Mycena rebaudengoi]|nr:hypothetical protein C8J57DRAFT_1258305 [Mycena rebaudengoi]
MPDLPLQFEDEGGEEDDDDVQPKIEAVIPPPNPVPPPLPAPNPLPPPPPQAEPRKLRDRGGVSLNVNQLMRQQMGWSNPVPSDDPPHEPHPIDDDSPLTPLASDDEDIEAEAAQAQAAAHACRAGLDYVYSGQFDNYLNHDEALEYAFNTSERASKASSSSYAATVG